MKDDTKHLMIAAFKFVISASVALGILLMFYTLAAWERHNPVDP